ncbi:MAG: acyltransferase [Chitinispirillaceae bacterium]
MIMKNRLLWPDLLKTLAILAVITIHSAAPLLIRYNQAGENYWWTANLFNSLSRWCIPVFFMLSGAFLIPKAHLSLTQFFKKRVQRIIVPFILWSFIYFLWRIHVNGEELQLVQFFPMLIQQPVYYHLWFFYVLIILYLFAPVLGVYFSCGRKSNAFYFFLLWLLSASILPLLQIYFDLNFHFPDSSENSPYYFLGYFFIGLMLRDITLQKREVPFFILLFLIGLLLTAYGTFDMVTANEGTFRGIFYRYNSPNVFLMAVSLFVLIKSIPLSQNRSQINLPERLASCVPGIFLVHAMIIAIYKQGMLGFTLSETMYHPAWGIPVFTLAVYGGSLFITGIIKMIPVVKHTVP